MTSFQLLNAGTSCVQSVLLPHKT